MPITEFSPAPCLLPYIESYWVLSGDEKEVCQDKLIPDGCSDLIVNLGDELSVPSEQVSLKSGKVYLGGAITHCVSSAVSENIELLGIKFKPGCFSNFYSYEPLGKFKNSCLEVEHGLLPPIDLLQKDFLQSLNRFFAVKITSSKHYLSPVISAIHFYKGRISISKLTEISCLTSRQLERNFNAYVGLTPKEYCNIVRFNYADELLCRKSMSILEIALQCGFYDTAHFTNEYKRYTGLSPSSI